MPSYHNHDNTQAEAEVMSSSSLVELGSVISSYFDLGCVRFS